MIKSTLKLMLAIVLFASCSQTEKAPSGMAYKITHGKGNEKLIKNGQVFKYTIEYKIKSSDSTIKPIDMPEYDQYDSASFLSFKYNFREIIGKLRKGDKVDISFSIDTLLKLQQVPPNDLRFKKGDFILGKLEILDVFSNIELAKADVLKEQIKYKEKQAKPIKEYLAKNKINAVETPEGVFVTIKNIGDTTNKVDSSKQVLVNYKGFHLNGEVFDTNIRPGDSTAKPFPVRIFESNVIPGWHYGLLSFSKGTTGTIYIPSYLAYGPNGDTKIKPNESIAFDIEVVDVKKKEQLSEQGITTMDQLNEQMKNEGDAKAKNSTKKEKKSTEKPSSKSTNNK
jgi:FKBP-type peptidyl-prolyl cis-trans isomerase FkpA